MAKKFVKKEVTPEVVSTFLDGYDPMERIVNFDYEYDKEYMTIYYRDENDNRCKTTEPFYPFLWATKDACLKLCNQDRNELIALMRKYGVMSKALDVTNSNGEVVEEILNGYTYMFYATKPMSYGKFLDFFKEAGNPVYSSKKTDENARPSFTDQPVSKKSSRQYLVVTPVEQFMISTGKRMFKGYDDYDQCLRLIFDLETTGLNTKTDRIEQFGIRFNRPVKYKGEYMTFERTYRTEGTTKEELDASELKNIENFIKIIYTFRPDIITAHNGEAFDWNILIGACMRLGTTIEEMSKKYFDGKSITKNKRETILKLGGEIETFHQTIVPGVIITDSLHAVRRAQALDSNMLFSNLKYVTKYSKIVKPNRVYVPGDKISEYWNDTTHRFFFNEEDGDWYIYDPTFVPKVITPDPTKTVEYFQILLDHDREVNEVSGGTIERKYSDFQTAEYLYDEYIKGIELENTNATTRKGKNGDKFTVYTKNVILDGYKEVTGQYIVNRYLLDDLWECDKVEHRYNTSNFLICKMLPVPFQKCCTMGTAGQWKAMMLAWSYENNLAIPPFGESKTFTGGLSRLLKVGFVDNVAKFDYNSLYPSIILTWGISDPKDLMGAMLHFLEYVLTNREKYKGLGKKASKAAEKIKERLHNRDYATKEEGNALRLEMERLKSEEAFNDKKQLPLKIFGNSFFGSYGAPNVFNWASIDCAERTTCTGRMALRLMIYYFNNLGYSPIVGDSFTPDTPLFIKWKDSGLIDILPVSLLINEHKVEIDGLGREYDYSSKPFEVLCRSGWVEPKYIYRHKTDKDIYEISDGNMKVNVTEDHSLFNDKMNKIKPSEISDDTKLEYYTNDIKPINIINSDINFTILGEVIAINGSSIIPRIVYNTTLSNMKKFYDGFMAQYRDDKEYSKTVIAGLQYIKNMLNK